MANIMINSECNLRCPYCFVNDFNYNKEDNISFENFTKAVDFITRKNNREQIGIIGGEPLLHPQFDKILGCLIENEKVDDIMVFTNGICMDQFWKELSHPKVKVLVNCNSEAIIGRSNYSKLVSNIEQAVQVKKLKDKIALGINIYKSDMDYAYIFQLLSRFHLDKLRLSIAVPNYELDQTFNALQYYSTMKPVTLDIIMKALEMGITPFFDCNRMPLCTIDDKDRRKILELSNQKVSNVILLESNCNPIIDILQDLTAVRCFGLSQVTRVNIKNFLNITDLRNYYKYKIDDLSHLVKASDNCQHCYNRIVKKCSSGCLSYKIDKIKEIASVVNSVI